MIQIPESDELARHAVRLVRSHRRWTGRDLVPWLDDPRALLRSVIAAPFVIVSHGAQADPILNFGNRVALGLWEMEWQDLIQTPSRYTAEPENREARAQLIAEVTRHGFIDNIRGIRISKRGRRFEIRQATVWNIIDDAEMYWGQAATFSHWDFL
jgi:hypothetical protein